MEGINVQTDYRNAFNGAVSAMYSIGFGQTLYVLAKEQHIRMDIINGTYYYAIMPPPKY